MHRSNWVAKELEATVLSMLQNVEMQARLKDISDAMKTEPGTSRAAAAVMDSIKLNAIAD